MAKYHPENSGYWKNIPLSGKFKNQLLLDGADYQLFVRNLRVVIFLPLLI